MTPRALFWIGALIAFSAIVSLYSAERAKISRELLQQQEQFQQAQVESMKIFLQKQKDGKKLIRLAKRLPSENAELIKLVVLRAYELEPNSRDIAVLASAYDPGAKARVKEIDPLYSE